MRKRQAWALGALVLFIIAAGAVFLGWDRVQTSTAKIQRDIELQAHRKLMKFVEQENHTPTAFVSDGCSGGLSKAWEIASGLFPGFADVHEESPPWEFCCVEHDRSYHSAGGATSADQSYELRLAADQTLRDCVLGTQSARSIKLTAHYGLTEKQVREAYKTIANAMYDAVRLGGAPCSGLSWRWGFGYPGCLLPLVE